MISRRAFVRLTLSALAAAPFLRTFGADVVSPLTSALPRIVAMSNPIGPTWVHQWFVNAQFLEGRQWLSARETGVVDEQGEVEVEWYAPRR